MRSEQINACPAYSSYTRSRPNAANRGVGTSVSQESPENKHDCVLPAPDMTFDKENWFSVCRYQYSPVRHFRDNRFHMAFCRWERTFEPYGTLYCKFMEEACARMLGPSYSFELQRQTPNCGKPVRLSDGLLAGGVGSVEDPVCCRGSAQASRGTVLRCLSVLAAGGPQNGVSRNASARDVHCR